MRDQIKKEGVRQSGYGRGARGDGPARRPLREDIADIDREILRLLLRRHNLLEKIRKKGRLDAAEEKFLRESWQDNVSRISRDAELSGRFFSLMQEITFLPRPAAGAEAENTPGPLRRQAFNLAPPRRPAHIVMAAPKDDRATRSWLYLGAAAGQALEIRHSLQNDPIIDCIKALDQMGAAISREDESITVRNAAPVGAPDKVIHLGDSSFNFYLLLAHYVGRHSRVKITGETNLKLADFSPLRHIMPELGARLVHIVPKSNGLPARLECSGLLPPGISASEDLPPGFVIALLLAAPFYEKPFSVSLGGYPRKEEVLAATLPMLKAIAANFSFNGNTVAIVPHEVKIPRKPELPADPEISACLLAFAAALGGKVELTGFWPDAPECGTLWRTLEATGLAWKADDGKLSANTPIKAFVPAKIPPEAASSRFLPLLAALLACAGLANQEPVAVPVPISPELTDFFHAAGLELDSASILKPLRNFEPPVWNAPTPQWAMALALAACSRRTSAGLQLGNPGILTELWPSFWAFYNSLPDPSARKAETAEPAPVKSRRRILTSVAAVPPEIREEDW